MAQEALIAYLALAAVTVLLTLGCTVVVRRTRQWSFPIGMAIIYFWTFAGAWFFIGDAATGYMGYRLGLAYYYLMEKMFPFELDGNYLAALGGYGVFTLLLLAVVLLVNGRRRAVIIPVAAPVRLDHRAFLVLALLAGIASFLLVRPLVMQAYREDLSIYLLTRTTAFPGATIHALCNEVSALSLLVGWALYLTADHPRYFTAMPTRGLRYAYPAMLVGLEVYLAFLGNKHELFMGLVLGSLLYFKNCTGRAAYAKYLAFATVCIVPLFIIGKVREHSVRDLQQGVVEETVDTSPFSVPIIAHVPRRPQAEGPVMTAGQLLLSNEMFAAHFSLYGIFRKDVVPVPAVSFRYLAASMVPRLVHEQRPPTAYDAYATGAGLMSGQGYTIHVASGWYMNGGWVALLAGALLIGLMWGALLRRDGRPLGSSLTARTFAVMGTSCWTAFLPMLVRAGPESAKAMVFEGFLLPVGLVLLAAAAAQRGRTAELVGNGA